MWSDGILSQMSDWSGSVLCLIKATVMSSDNNITNLHIYSLDCLRQAREEQQFLKSTIYSPST